MMSGGIYLQGQGKQLGGGSTGREHVYRHDPPPSVPDDVAPLGLVLVPRHEGGHP